MISDPEVLIIKFPSQALPPFSSILHRKTQVTHQLLQSIGPQLQTTFLVLHCFFSPLFFLNFRSTHLEIRSLLFLSNTTHSDQTHKHYQIKPIQTKKIKKNKNQTTQMNGHERDRNWRERRRSDFKIVRENRIGAFCDVPEQREKLIGVGHGRPNSTRLSPLRKLAAKPFTVSASGS